MHPYIEFVNPHLGKLLQDIGLDKRFQRGQGPYLYDHTGQEYLDCIAAYGALPFGYNPPEIWRALHELEARQEPSFIQPSLLEAAGELAARLIALAPSGFQYVTFANSGAEAVEAAFKLVRAKTGKPVILSTRNSFHGKTLGALSATGNENYQSAFGAPVPGFRHIPYGDLEALESYLAEHAGDTAAFIVEPIQGEGGIVEPPQGYLKQVQELCARHGVLTIFDEIQTGLGRTGALFACAEEGVTPDVMVLAKALGGGLIPIGAVLCRAEVYTEDFGLKHSSTFAGNSLGARVGLAVLELLTKDDGALLRSVREKGAKLKAGLERVAAKYPQVVKAIRGRGFMLGIEFVNSRDPYPHSLLGVMAEQELLTPMVASYLLNVERVRVAPTLNGASVIRIEPPLTMGETEIERVVQAVERACGLLASRNTAAFLGHLIGYSRPAALNGAAQPQTVEEARPQPGDGRFAFLVHPVDLDNYSEFDASLADLTAEQLEDLSSRWNDLVEPFVVASTRVVDNCGRSAYGDFICVPKTAAQLLAMDKEQSRREILAAIDLAVERGARLVGLGAYTSVVTMGGRQLLPYTDVALTTGNSYTVVSGVEAAVSAAKEVGLEMATATGAVVGAGGAIGKALAILLSEQVQNLILIGNPARPEKSEYRMLKVAVEIIQHLRTLAGSGRQLAPGSLGAFAAQLDSVPAEDAPLSVWVEFAREVLASGAPLTLTVDSRAHLPRADLILAATSSLEALITPDVLKRGAVVCDMSRPSNVSKEVLEERPDVLVIDGGVIALPGSPDLGWNFGFEKGTAFACMSETMMLALEGRYEHMSIGADLSLEHLELMRGLAKKLGFTLAGFRAFDRPLDPAVWERVRALRKKETA
ncbi:aminotransferase class III-fold pyridoxal phosphate-dependent enzyme [Candidatus Darwinibacter acetoxidans]|jgi:acetylornithine/succinyldiaminopimelate/putrescine aminotransferase/predicted amino acid dehydrogenase|nr:aminotransferase class III-fold pyridoxal phosphate-dependent enzyme [Bacillota bacterium]HOK31674.1 aminotransferase class III-fold pyridoxal phosphate-dependent enzyme [Limnochordia bacterium]NLO94696.1 aminotransferase class III-fold pyridoxal phosphate-dependent enzyme [Bacillota bacterium]HOL99919.1 aminotransferase class III-fold pyridoxal phosphate-dependent enzyme [Limnochordia bacterium]HPP72546.1 aminotransferase class III-fold pyridoxal phosphate-dependent enzyme [Limnochordia bac